MEKKTLYTIWLKSRFKVVSWKSWQRWEWKAAGKYLSLVMIANENYVQSCSSLILLYKVITRVMYNTCIVPEAISDFFMGESSPR